jgi:hypothetical protein
MPALQIRTSSLSDEAKKRSEEALTEASEARSHSMKTIFTLGVVILTRAITSFALDAFLPLK